MDLQRRSQNYTVSGSAVNFGIGLINNASAGQTISISNNISGATLSQAGASTLMLTGTNSFANTTISAGSIVLSGSGSLGNSLVTLGTTGTIATLDISGTSAGATIQGLEGNSSGVVTLGNQTLTSSNGSAANIFYGAINGSGGLTVSGGQQVLGGGNGYTGVTTVNSNAMLIIEGNGTIAASSKVVVDGAFDISTTISGTSIKSLAGTDTNGQVGLGNHTLTITAANDTFAGVITGGGGNGGLTLTGGTQTLTGTNDYIGATSVNGGTLVVNGAISPSSFVLVNRRRADGHWLHRQHQHRRRHLRARLGHAGIVDDGEWHARFRVGIDLCRQYQSDHIVVCQRDRHRDAGRRNGQC